MISKRIIHCRPCKDRSFVADQNDPRGVVTAKHTARGLLDKSARDVQDDRVGSVRKIKSLRGFPVPGGSFQKCDVYVVKMIGDSTARNSLDGVSDSQNVSAMEMSDAMVCKRSLIWCKGSTKSQTYLQLVKDLDPQACTCGITKGWCAKLTRFASGASQPRA